MTRSTLTRSRRKAGKPECSQHRDQQRPPSGRITAFLARVALEFLASLSSGSLSACERAVLRFSRSILDPRPGRKTEEKTLAWAAPRGDTAYRIRILRFYGKRVYGMDKRVN